MDGVFNELWRIKGKNFAIFSMSAHIDRYKKNYESNQYGIEQADQRSTNDLELFIQRVKMFASKI